MYTSANLPYSARPSNQPAPNTPHLANASIPYGAGHGTGIISGRYLPIPREITVSKRRAPPVAPEIKLRAKESLAKWVRLAEEKFQRALFMPTISFDLVGTTAGKAFLTERHIQLSAVLLTENPEHFDKDTIPHELAHLLAYHLYGYKEGHGEPWKSTMRRLGLEPARTHRLDVTNARTTEVVGGYFCRCKEHEVSKRMHNKLARGASVKCLKCNHRLTRDPATVVGAGISAGVAAGGRAGAGIGKSSVGAKGLVLPVVPTHIAGRATHPSLPGVKPPSPAMLRFAESLAKKHYLSLPLEVSSRFDACKAFLDKWSNVAAAAIVPTLGGAAFAPVTPTVTPTLAPAPASPFVFATPTGYSGCPAQTPVDAPTPAQLNYAKSIAVRKRLTISPEALGSKRAMSAWIDANK